MFREYQSRRRRSRLAGWGFSVCLSKVVVQNNSNPARMTEILVWKGELANIMSLWEYPYPTMSMMLEEMMMGAIESR